MRVRALAVVAVAALVALSGCAAFEQTNDDPSNETDVDYEDPEESSDAGESGDNDDGGSETDADSGGDDTAEASWSPPEEPNRPMEDEREDRIESVTFVDKEPAENGEGYSNFNLEVVANTSMENVDPPEHGDVEGEPYFFVKINEDEQKIVERTGEVRMADNGTFHIDVRPAGIEEFGEGPLTVEVFLMDEDKDWDDIYASVGTEIHFNPGTDGASDEPADDGSETNESDDDTDDGPATNESGDETDDELATNETG